MTAPTASPALLPSVLLVDDRPENLVALEAVLSPLVEETGVRLLRAGGGDDDAFGGGDPSGTTLVGEGGAGGGTPSADGEAGGAPVRTTQTTNTSWWLDFAGWWSN